MLEIYKETVMQLTAKMFWMMLIELSEKITDNCWNEHKTRIIPAPCHSRHFINYSIYLPGDTTLEPKLLTKSRKEYLQ